MPWEVIDLTHIPVPKPWSDASTVKDRHRNRRNTLREEEQQNFARRSAVGSTGVLLG